MGKETTMKFIGNWEAWESKDGSEKRIYLGDGKYFKEGDSGLPSQVGLNVEEIAFASKLVQGKTFIELYEMVKKSNNSKKTNKKSVAALKKEEKELLANAKTNEEREEIIVKYAKLKKEAKYANFNN